MNKWYKNRIFIAVIILVALIGLGLFIFKGNGGNTDDSDSSSFEPKKGEILVEGTIACLPYKNESVKKDCVKSIKGNDGKVYALNTTDVNFIENAMPEGTKVAATGKYQPADVQNTESNVFKYDGVLVVRSLVRR